MVIGFERDDIDVMGDINRFGMRGLIFAVDLVIVCLVLRLILWD